MASYPTNDQRDYVYDIIIQYLKQLNLDFTNLVKNVYQFDYNGCYYWIPTIVYYTNENENSTKIYDILNNDPNITNAMIVNNVQLYIQPL